MYILKPLQCSYFWIGTATWKYFVTTQITWPLQNNIVRGQKLLHFIWWYNGKCNNVSQNRKTNYTVSFVRFGPYTLELSSLGSRHASQEWWILISWLMQGQFSGKHASFHWMVFWQFDILTMWVSCNFCD